MCLVNKWGLGKTNEIMGFEIRKEFVLCTHFLILLMIENNEAPLLNHENFKISGYYIIL